MKQHRSVCLMDGGEHRPVRNVPESDRWGFGASKTCKQGNFYASAGRIRTRQQTVTVKNISVVRVQGQLNMALIMVRSIGPC
jgi:hypothetical protein